MKRKLSTLFYVMLLVLFCQAQGIAEETTSKIIKTHGNGFLEQKANGMRVLHLKGNAYERGYQRAIMMGKHLERQIIHDLMQVCMLIGGKDFEKGLAIVKKKAEIAKPFIPYQFRDEMKGLADGLKTIGSNLTYDDIILHAVSDDLLMMDSKSSSLDKDSISKGYPPVRCASFSAWGEATKSGSLIFGGNEDYFEDVELLKERPAVVIDPTDGGYGYTGGIWNLWHGGGGMNEAGIAMKAHLSFSSDETLRGVLSDMLIRMVLQYSDSIEDAIEIISSYPRTCGIIIHIADAKTNRAAVIEYTASDVAVRFPQEGLDALWNTNHFNSYPGWQGYEGPNLVKHNEKRLKLDLTSIETWQTSLRTGKNGKGPKGRYGRLQQLMKEHRGNIDIEKAKTIMSDRFNIIQNRKLKLNEPNSEEKRTRTISSFRTLWTISKNPSFYKSDEKGDLVVQSGTVWSFVAKPSTSEIWWSLGDVPPVNYTAGYRYLNLKKELSRNR